MPEVMLARGRPVPTACNENDDRVNKVRHNEKYIQLSVAVMSWKVKPRAPNNAPCVAQTDLAIFDLAKQAFVPGVTSVTKYPPGRV
jgi:hypothetical protein